MQAIKTQALIVISYPAGKIIQPQEDIDATDLETQNLLTMHRGLYPKSSTLSLYEQWKKKR